jgi:hypothetical protein
MSLPILTADQIRDGWNSLIGYPRINLIQAGKMIDSKADDLRSPQASNAYQNLTAVQNKRKFGRNV